MARRREKTDRDFFEEEYSYNGRRGAKAIRWLELHGHGDGVDYVHNDARWWDRLRGEEIDHDFYDDLE